MPTQPGETPERGQYKLQKLPLFQLEALRVPSLDLHSLDRQVQAGIDDDEEWLYPSSSASFGNAASELLPYLAVRMNSRKREDKYSAKRFRDHLLVGVLLEHLQRQRAPQAAQTNTLRLQPHDRGTCSVPAQHGCRQARPGNACLDAARGVYC